MTTRQFCSWGAFDMGDVYEDCIAPATKRVTVRNGPTVTSSGAYCDKHAHDRELSLAHNHYRGITVTVEPLSQ